MMYNYPFFSFPSFRNYNYYPIRRINNISSNRSNLCMDIKSNYNSNYSNMKHLSSNNKKVKQTVYSHYENKLPINCNSLTSDKNYNELFNIFGIKLYFDDILLISLIFFLYTECVKDDYLFISLILLLLS